MKKVPFIIILAILCALNQASAVEFTLDQCIDLALKNNSGLKALEMDVVSAKEEVNIAQKSFFPSLKLNGNYFLLDRTPRLIVDRNSFGPGIPALNSEIPTQDSSFYLLNIFIEQPLFTGGKLKHSYLKSKALDEETFHRIESQKRQLILDVRHAFFAALNARLYAGIVEKALESKEERLRVLRELLVEGYSSQEDILQQETDIQFTELELFKGTNRESMALSRLRNFIQYTGGDELQLKGTPLNIILTASLDQVKEAAIANREDLKAAHARSKAAEEEIAIAKSSFYPRASLTGNFIQQKETNITRSQSWMLTAQLEWALFEWGKTISEVGKKTAQKQKVLYETDELKKDALLKVENVWRAFKEQEKTVQAHEKKVRTASYRLKLVTERYSEGKVKISEVIDMEAGFIKDCNEYSAAINDLNSTSAKLEESTSTPVDNWVRTDEIFIPDNTTFSHNLKKSLRKKERTAESGAVTGAPAGVSQQLRRPASDGNNVQTDPTVVTAGQMGSTPPAGPQESIGQSTKSPPDALPRKTATFPVEIQVASFKNRNHAEAFGKKLKKSLGEREIRILSQGEFYKVRITGFHSTEEAEEIARTLELRNCLIVKATRGQ